MNTTATAKDVCYMTIRGNASTAHVSLAALCDRGCHHGFDKYTDGAVWLRWDGSRWVQVGSQCAAETHARAILVRVYLPETFISDARECDPDLWELWDRIANLPRVRRGGGYGRWAELTADEARAISKEAEYRRQYWLTDAYGVENIAPYERAAGKAAERVAAHLRGVLDHA